MNEAAKPAFEGSEPPKRRRLVLHQTQPCYRVGITLFVNADGDFGLFENGLRQNVVFLYRMFKASARCTGVYLLNHGDGEAMHIPPGLDIDPADVVRTSQVAANLDYVICVGAAMDRETVAALKAAGCKLINYKGGNGAVISMEALISKPPRPDAERYFDVADFDAIWMTPQHLHTYRGWVETLYRRPVWEVPQIWEPLFIQQRPSEVVARFGYKPTQEPWRVGMMDPNITVMKTSHIPMLVCDVAYRNAPEAFSAFFITNGWPHRDNLHFRSFYQAMAAAKDGRMTLEPRFVSPDFLANHADAVVTHQWENGLNYLYYEVLYGGYPLIHNSPFLKDYGYYYADFDAAAGGAALLRAKAEHDQKLSIYRARNQGLIESLDPKARANIELHEGLLDRLQLADAP